MELLHKFFEKFSKYVNWDLFVDRVLDDAWIFGLILLLELVFLGYQRSSLARLIGKPTGRADAVTFLADYSGLNVFIGLVLSFGVISLVSRYGQLWLGVDWAAVHAAQPWTLPVLGVAAVVLGDFFYYLYHRLLHTRLLWPIHRYHHSAEEFCTLTSIRSHPLEAAMDALPSAFAFALLGVPTGIAATLFTFKRFITAFHHSQFQGDWGWAGRWLLIAPRMHLIHHSIDPKHYGSNYGSMLPIWDRLFGTCVDDSHSAIRLGLIDGERESGSYVRGSALGYLKFWAGLRDQMRGKAATAY